jgi:hypothetical protein
VTQEVRSKNMNSSADSWADRGALMHASGKRDAVTLQLFRFGECGAFGGLGGFGGEVG